MRRIGGLWGRLTSWENLCEAVRRAAGGKRRRPDVAAFLLNWEAHVVELRRELLGGTYQPGGYRNFMVREPKPREISAAPFRDRVVHHALTQVLEPVFEPRFARQSYACRLGLGTHKALDACAAGCRGTAYVLKCDIRKYFPSIDHELLLADLGKVVKCERTLDLAGRIVNGFVSGQAPVQHFPGDDLFSALERPRGLPLGNQTSQFFANVYLNGFDQFVLRTVRPRLYCRYVDDFLLFHPEKGFLGEARGRVEEFLEGRRLQLHEGKTRVYRTEDGVTFLGWRVFPDRRRLVRGNVVRFRRALSAMRNELAEGRLGFEQVQQRVRAWVAHADHGDTWRLREQIFDWAALTVGQSERKDRERGKKKKV